MKYFSVKYRFSERKISQQTSGNNNSVFGKKQRFTLQVIALYFSQISYNQSSVVTEFLSNLISYIPLILFYIIYFYMLLEILLQ